MSHIQTLWEDWQNLNVGTLNYASENQGPGTRFVIGTQGCQLDCPGCVNQHLRVKKLESQISIYNLIERIGISINSVCPTEGITLIGGEPLNQSPAVAKLLLEISKFFPNFNILLFTGFTRREVARAMEINKNIEIILGLVDTVISGRYVEPLRDPSLIAGSTNQEIIHLNQKRLKNRSFARLDSAGYSVMTGALNISGFNISEF